MDVDSEKKHTNSRRMSLLRGGGGSGPKFLKTVFEIMVDPKRSPNRPIFCSGLEASDALAPAWRPRPFSSQKDFFSKIHQKHDFSSPMDKSLLSSHKKFQPYRSKFPKNVPFWQFWYILENSTYNRFWPSPFYSLCEIPGRILKKLLSYFQKCNANLSKRSFWDMVILWFLGGF